MKNSTPTYQLLSKITAALLLAAFLLPSGLHANQLVEFCTTERNHHEAHASTAHDCCESETHDKKESESQHNNCDWGFICACSIGQSQLGDEEWIPVSKEFAFQLSEKKILTPFISSNEQIHSQHQIQVGEHDPPLWLVYDTFLN